MFEQNEIPKKSNLGILRQITEISSDDSFNIEINRQQLIKDIKEGKFRK